MPAVPSPPRLRRRPQQARSQRRVEHVLDTADRVLAEEGADALTTTRVADAAGISVGSLYQWFPDKEAILEALALRYLDGFNAVMAGLAARGKLGDDPAGIALDTFAEAFRARPGFRAMWFGGLRTEELRDATRPGLDELGSTLAQVLGAHAPEVPAERVAIVSRITVTVADALLRQAFRNDPEGDEFVLSEARTLLRGYLADQLGIRPVDT
ncbi:MAG TPA: TetR/AcrR family transcriptional regulator [Solirubrobacteraceae bacterium]